jgi:succinate dehydrogenase / fumarate reductase iron-sulfur subunit
MENSQNASNSNMNLNLKIWRQSSPSAEGKLVDYKVTGISPDMSFLEMLDVLNQDLIKKNEDPVVFDHDCREGICGSCSMMVNGAAHGPQRATTVCQLHMRAFKDGDTIVVEPWRAKAFPVRKDLWVDRSAFERIQQAGGFISINTGNARDANNIPISKQDVDKAFDYAACIGCGACVASCKNASASLFVAARVGQFSLLPQGAPERETRVLNMVAQMDKEGFGACSNTGACSAACPKEISLESIARLNREYMKASFFHRETKAKVED